MCKISILVSKQGAKKKPRSVSSIRKRRHAQFQTAVFDPVCFTIERASLEINHELDPASLAIPFVECCGYRSCGAGWPTLLPVVIGDFPRHVPLDHLIICVIGSLECCDALRGWETYGPTSTFGPTEMTNVASFSEFGDETEQDKEGG